MRKILAAFVIIGGIFATMFSPAYAATQDIVTPPSSQRIADAQIILNEINDYRYSLGIQPVKYSGTLSEVVQVESDRQVREESVYHTNNFLDDPRSGSYSSAGEVIALSYQRDVSALVDWWISSPPHEAILSDPRHEVIGIGITYADGNLTNTGQGWQVLSTVSFYGYATGNEPLDTVSSVGSVPESVTPPTPVNNVGGAIGAHYYRLGGASVLGVPRSDERCGLIMGGCYQEFILDGGVTSIMWTPYTGAHTLKYNGAIGQKWMRYGREHNLGFPTTDEINLGSEVIQSFSNGSTIHWAPGRGTWITR